FFFHAPSTTEIYPLSLHDALPISGGRAGGVRLRGRAAGAALAAGAAGAAAGLFTAALAAGVAGRGHALTAAAGGDNAPGRQYRGSEEHTSELQSQSNLVCRLLLEK